MEVSFMDRAWEDYEYWQTQDKKIIKRINKLIKDARRNPEDGGIGKAEKLKAPLTGWLSKRIDGDGNRMVYRYVNDDSVLQIATLRYHY